MALLADSGATIMNLLILASAVVPLAFLGVLCWVFFRAARRNDEREAAARESPRAG
jgi:hypothetical protein